MRETEWVRRILSQGADVTLCICGRVHVEPFMKKLEEKGCTVEHTDLSVQVWFRKRYGIYSIAEQDGERCLETRRT
jgi:hypothetical protein